MDGYSLQHSALVPMFLRRGPGEILLRQQSSVIENARSGSRSVIREAPEHTAKGCERTDLTESIAQSCPSRPACRLTNLAARQFGGLCVSLLSSLWLKGRCDETSKAVKQCVSFCSRRCEGKARKWSI
jgi:hypothetical protein